MPIGFSAEAEDFGRSVAGVLDEAWGDATGAPTGDLGALTRTAVAQGWFELGPARALDFLVVAVRELGRRACPLPVTDAYVTALLGDGELADRVADGSVRPVLAVGGPGARPLVEDSAATHLLRLDPAAGSAELVEITGTAPAPGLAVPDWHHADLGAVAALPAAAGAVREAAGILRLGVAVRALAAAGRAHELAVAHATTRRQFGRTIGAFGAVQQRVAAGEIALRAGEQLVLAAAGTTPDGGPRGLLPAALAVRFAEDAAVGILAGAQHTLGAIGYFEEHEAAWLFRRVHADVLRLRSGRGTTSAVDAMLVEEGGSLPPLDLGPVSERFRTEVRDLLATFRSVDGRDAYDVEGLRARMAEQGLFALGWPRSHGGREATLEEQVVLNEEMKYAGGPVDRAMSATLLLGHSILRHGTAEQQAEFLPLLRAGRMAFCLGYSEPEVGSDLASLRTRAERDGEGWVINGQKAWTTRGHTASHVWLAVRTDPDARPRHAGITIFLVPMDTPGITVQQHVALSGEISCTVFYDDVRVPVSSRVGEVNGGWRVITDALASERIVMGGISSVLLRQLDDVLALLRAEPARLGPPGSAVRDRLASLAARLQATRALVLAATRATDGRDARLYPPMAAVLGGEVAEEFGAGLLEILGPEAALAGPFEAALRLAPMYVIGGGTNDIQRGIIARALGLARE